MKLSIIVIVQEQEANTFQTRRAIESAQFADETLVIPAKSPISDFSEVRNRALERARGEWVMFLDSDEEISPKLAVEIEQVLKMPNSKLSRKAGSRFAGQVPNGYKMIRRDKFLGQWLNHGETAHAKFLRLARKKTGIWIRPVHEVWNVSGHIETLQNPLLHYSHQKLKQMLEKIDYYSTLESVYRNRKIRYNHSGRNHYTLFLIFEFMFFPAGKFLKNYFFRLGFMDGIPGFIHAMMMSFHSFLVRAKLITMNKKQ